MRLSIYPESKTYQRIVPSLDVFVILLQSIYLSIHLDTNTARRRQLLTLHVLFCVLVWGEFHLHMNFTRSSCPFFHDCSIAENSLCHLIALKRTLPSLIKKNTSRWHDPEKVKASRHMYRFTMDWYYWIIPELPSFFPISFQYSWHEIDHWRFFSSLSFFFLAGSSSSSMFGAARWWRTAAKLTQFWSDPIELCNCL